MASRSRRMTFYDELQEQLANNDMDRHIPNHGYEDSRPDMGRRESNRPPQLSSTCPSHGSLEGGLQESNGGGEGGGDEPHGNYHEAGSSTTQSGNVNGSNTDSDGESDYEDDMNYEEGVDELVDVADLGLHPRSTIVRAQFARYRRISSDCPCRCRLVRAPTPPSPAYSMQASPAYSTLASPSHSIHISPSDSMVVEVGSRSPSITFEPWRSASPDLFAFMGGHTDELDFFLVPRGFVMPPLRLTATPVGEPVQYLYHERIDDEDMDI